MNIYIVIPTYNESENISDLITQIMDLSLRVNVIIVDDNSPDGTGEIVDQLAAKNGRIIAIHRPAKLGLGTAYVAGFKKALECGASKVITMDADFSHNPSYIPALVSLSEKYSIVIGSRYVTGGAAKNCTKFRILLSKASNMFARTLLRLKAKDCTAGFRCYSSDSLTTVKIDEILSSGYSFLIEMIFKCQKLNFSIGEIPIVFDNRQRGKSKISRREIYKAILTVFRLALIDKT